ncbi:MAG: bifunctional glutamate--cysteine ligase GshA/glutathione synthetase GshB [Fibrobacterota bacterium]
MQDLWNISSETLFSGRFGFERELLRLQEDLTPAPTPHPYTDKLGHPFVKTDYAEIQLELITRPAPTMDTALRELADITAMVYEDADEAQLLLWHQSMPPAAAGTAQISRFNRSKEGIRQETYRRHLEKRYGTERMLISGIHCNISFSRDLIDELHRRHAPHRDAAQFQDELYLKAARGLADLRWLLIYLTGTTPADTAGLRKGALSLRNSREGYRNAFDDAPPFTSLAEYCTFITECVQSGKLAFPQELYYPIRLKNSRADTVEDLARRGIEYLEIRCLDIDPFDPLGISAETAAFTHLLMVYTLTHDVPEEYRGEINHEEICTQGLSTDAIHRAGHTQDISLSAAAIDLAERIAAFAETVGAPAPYRRAAQIMQKRARGKEPLPAAQIRDAVQQQGFTAFGREQSRRMRAWFRAHRFECAAAPNLELSSKILLREATRAGIPWAVIDENDNFIALQKKGRRKLVKQATKTGADSYISVLAMENKAVTKQLLTAQEIPVPAGKVYADHDAARRDYLRWQNTPLVIKPNSTNFGIGITIFPQPPARREYEEALAEAFGADDTILAEHFFAGPEYRFFVINGKSAAVLRRVPANICGDGVSTIAELVTAKNRDPLRGTGYVTPLEKISLQKAERRFLKQSGRTPQSIPAAGEVVYLRENSNISTGGDSLDFTDEMHRTYKAAALRAATAADAAICGVDMIVRDMYAPAAPGNHTIIELNFNPAIHIHCYPFQGKNRRLGREVLHQLGL